VLLPDSRNKIRPLPAHEAANLRAAVKFLVARGPVAQVLVARALVAQVQVARVAHRSRRPSP